MEYTHFLLFYFLLLNVSNIRGHVFGRSVVGELSNKRSSKLPNDCGHQISNNKIFNGSTSLTEYPWTALISYSQKHGSEISACGGVLISNRYVVTGAHCVTGNILSIGTPQKVRLGEWNIETDPDCLENDGDTICNDQPIDFGVDEVIPHSGYIDSSIVKYHDIALIRLDRDVTFTDYIRPVCLSQSTDQFGSEQKLRVVSWSNAREGGLGGVRHQMLIPVVSNSECELIYNKVKISFQDGQFCAGGKLNTNSCLIYSGASLLNEKNNQFFLEGIFSFGPACGKSDWPDVYTRISNYRDWIENNIRP